MQCGTRVGRVAAACLLIGAAVGVSCSGPREDVRVSFCKDLVETLFESPGALEWKGSEQEIRRPEFAKIMLTFTVRPTDTGDAFKQATCFYEYAVPEENALTHSDPLSAYATVPYRMIVDGEPVALSDLGQAINTAALNQVTGLLDRLGKAMEDAAEYVKEKLNPAA